MRKLALIALIVLAPLFALNLHAQTATTGATLKFTAPVTHTDGSGNLGPLSYAAYYGAKGSSISSKTKFATPVKPDGSVVIPNVPWGTCFQVIVTETQAANVPIDGAPTNEACLPFPPNGATNLTVTVTIQINSP